MDLQDTLDDKVTSLLVAGSGKLQNDPLMRQECMCLLMELKGFSSIKYEQQIMQAMNIKGGEYQSIVKNAKIKNELGFVPIKINDLIKCFVDKNKLQVMLNGQIKHGRKINLKGAEASYAEVMQMTENSPGDRAMAKILWSEIVSPSDVLTWLRILIDDLSLRFNWPTAEAAFLAWVDQERKERQWEVYSSVMDSFTPVDASKTSWRLWAEAVCQNLPDQALTIAVMQSFIWQIKRKMTGDPVSHHLMPIFYGQQGGGKSEAIKKFLTPLGEGWSGASFADIEDSRMVEKFFWYPVLFFDEMEYAGKADIEAIKGRITQDVLSYRPLYSNAIKQVANKACSIGATNRRVAELITDTTGMRRFYEVECRDRLDWDVINQTDYYLLWKSVNPFADNPIKPFLDDLSVTQKAMTAKSNVEIWLESGLDQTKPYLDGQYCPFEYGKSYGATDLFRAFSEWESNYLKVKISTSLKGFGMRMMDLAKRGLIDRSVDRKEKTYYVIHKRADHLKIIK